MYKDILKFEQLLLEGIIANKGLPHIALQLMKKIKKPIAIVDRENNFLVVQSNIDLKNHSWENKKSNYYFNVGKEKIIAKIIIAVSEKSWENDKYINYLKSASMAIRLYYGKLKARQEIEKRYKGEFIQDLLFNNISSSKEVIDRGKIWNWDLKNYHLVVVIEPDENIDMNVLSAKFEKYFKNFQNDLIYTYRNGQMVIIWTVEELRNDLYICIQDIFLDFKKVLSEKKIPTFSVGIGQYYESVKDINKSYQEAKTALAIYKIIGQKDFIKNFLSLGVFKFLYKLDSYILKEFYFETLGKIIEYDQNNNGDLIISLEKLLDNNVDWKKTSQELYIHVNTLRYRIKKIEEILNLDLNKLENQINLYIALKIGTLLQIPDNKTP